MGEFNNKVVWITGAGTGIGKAGAVMFAEEGATAVLIGRRRDKLEETAAKIKAKGGKCVVEPLDVGDRAQVNAAAKRLLDQFKRVDILVNNAGLNVKNRRMDVLSQEDWDLVIRVNLTGAYNLFHAVFPTMKEQKDGLVINVSSTASKNPSGVAGMAYQSSKFGMTGLSVSLSTEAWKFGIRTCCIFPDDVNTPILEGRPVKYSEEELSRMLQPEDLAATLKFVASLPPRASIPEIIVYPTFIRPYTKAETGLP
jgi:NADP-dependent 3-hydroxy acid dehydrogenase YdfG